jgi:TorA maturation chaperone TorD
MTAEPSFQPGEQAAFTPMEGEGESRASVYGLIAALLRAVPSRPLIDTLAALEINDRGDELGKALSMLRLAADSVSLAEIDDEYHRLFIGLGRGELVPYASWYLTGFLMEKPLGELRRDLQLLGFDRQKGVSEPEDHVAALAEVMAMLILDEAVDLETEQKFFDKHIGCWADRLFEDLERSESAVFYRAVGRLGAVFVDLERRYLAQEI